MKTMPWRFHGRARVSGKPSACYIRFRYGQGGCCGTDLQYLHRNERKAWAGRVWRIRGAGGMGREGVGTRAAHSCREIHRTRRREQACQTRFRALAFWPFLLMQAARSETFHFWLSVFCLFIYIS